MGLLGTDACDRAYPSRQSPSETERALAAWLQRSREDARAGKLAQEYREGLAVLSEWETPITYLRSWIGEDGKRGPRYPPFRSAYSMLFWRAAKACWCR
jgi:hypothetical protein